MTLEASENQDSTDMIGPVIRWNQILNQRMTFDVSCSRSGYWWPDVPWTTDVRRVDLTTTETRGAFLEQNREPARWGWNATWSWFTEISGMNHEVKSGTLGYRGTSLQRVHGLPEPAAVPVPEPDRRVGFLPASRLRAGVRLSDQHEQRQRLQLVVSQRQHLRSAPR